MNRIQFTYEDEAECFYENAQPGHIRVITPWGSAGPIRLDDTPELVVAQAIAHGLKLKQRLRAI
jgi:hypothetical protein